MPGKVFGLFKVKTQEERDAFYTNLGNQLSWTGIKRNYHKARKWQQQHGYQAVAAVNTAADLYQGNYASAVWRAATFPSTGHFTQPFYDRRWKTYGVIKPSSRYLYRQRQRKRYSRFYKRKYRKSYRLRKYLAGYRIRKKKYKRGITKSYRNTS